MYLFQFEQNCWPKLLKRKHLKPARVNINNFTPLLFILPLKYLDRQMVIKRVMVYVLLFHFAPDFNCCCFIKPSSRYFCVWEKAALQTKRTLSTFTTRCWHSWRDSCSPRTSPRGSHLDASTTSVRRVSTLAALLSVFAQQWAAQDQGMRCVGLIQFGLYWKYGHCLSEAAVT